MTSHFCLLLSSFVVGGASAALGGSPCLELPPETVAGCADRTAVVEAIVGLDEWDQPASPALEAALALDAAEPMPPTTATWGGEP